MSLLLSIQKPAGSSQYEMRSPPRDPSAAISSQISQTGFSLPAVIAAVTLSAAMELAGPSFVRADVHLLPLAQNLQQTSGTPLLWSSCRAS